MSKNVVTIGALIVLTIVLSIFIFYKVEYQYYENIYDNDVNNTVSLISKKIQSVTNASETTAVFFSLKDNVSEKEFNDFASVVMKNISSGGAVSTTVEWVDSNNIVKYVYPLDDDRRQVVGLDLNKYPNRLDPILKAKNLKSTIFSDPIMFVEGYPGILVYSPIFRGSEYKGQIIVAIGLFNILDLSTKESTAESEKIYLKTGDLFVPFYKNKIYNGNGERILNAQGELEKDSDVQNYYIDSNKLITKNINFSDKNWQINFSPTYITKTYKSTTVFAIIASILTIEIISFVWLLFKIKSKRK